MTTMDIVTPELAEELKGRTIVLENTELGSALGNQLTRGTLLEIYPPNHRGHITIKYTPEDVGYGSLDALDEVTWKQLPNVDGKFVATFTNLHSTHERTGDQLHFNERTLRGSTLLVLPALAAVAA